MPTNTADATPKPAKNAWHIYYGDVLAGALAIRTGNPHDTEPWEWRCGFYPGSRPGECSSGTSESFEQATAIYKHSFVDAEITPELLTQPNRKREIVFAKTPTKISEQTCRFRCAQLAYARLTRQWRGLFGGVHRRLGCQHAGLGRTGGRRTRSSSTPS